MIKKKNQLQKLALIMKAKGKRDVVRQIRAIQAVGLDKKKSGIVHNFMLAITRFFL
jgi:hypothetical protein